MEKTITENKFVRLTVEDGILHINYQEETEIHLFSAIEIMKFLEEFCQEKKYFILEDMSNIKWIDKQSRDYFAQHSLNEQMEAWAFYSSQSIHKIMYEIYNTFSKPRGKSAFFTNKEEGLKWLSGLRDQGLGL